MKNKINLTEKFSIIDTHWDPKIVGELNGQEVKLVKFQGEFIWHRHETADELFLVMKGSFDMQFRDRTIPLSEGEMIIVPKGVDHCPKAKEEVQVMLFEPVNTVNTGDNPGQFTVTNPLKI